jgi:hypothetical protein
VLRYLDGDDTGALLLRLIMDILRDWLAAPASIPLVLEKIPRSTFYRQRSLPM